ncbi:MAG: hypothetical protein D4R90_05500 [Nitrosopumilales archaeon]|nr:MAG: hypothetical protein D4R90_05500 [Nitrosopumilales archaeon]
MIENQIQNQSRTEKRLKNKIQLVLAISVGSLLLSASYLGFAYADTGQTSGNIQIKATDAIKNDPGMMKILNNLEIFKQKYAALQQKQDLMAQQKSLIDGQRKIANDYLQADLASSNNLNDMSNPTNAYASFVSKVDNSAQNVFLSQFAYMQAKVANGKLAMNKVLQNGGTKDEALNAYYSGASTQMTELVSVNKDINIKYHLADGNIQNMFNKYGNLKKYSAS